MQLLPYPESEPIQVKLDWLELTCLSNEYFILRMSEVRNILENLDSFSSPDIGGEDADVENEILRLLEQYTYRSGVLQECYPFVFNEESLTLELKQPDLEQLEIGNHIYLYCLYFSHMASSRLFSDINPPTNAHRDLLQVAATIALAGFVSGHSVSFGWPRPDSSKFYDALVSTVQKIGEGVVKPFSDVNSYLRGRPVKDAGIDVIAWGDGNPMDIMPGGRIICFAQVASGNNWRSKPVRGDIDAIQRYWMEQQISRVSDAIVIPFDIESDTLDRAKDYAAVIADEFGHFFHRLRLPIFVKNGLELSASNPALLIERVDDVSNIVNYVVDVTSELRDEAA